MKSNIEGHVTAVPQPISPAAATCKRKTGRKKFRETRHPVYRGVRERNGGKWVCEVREPVWKTRIWLGTYPTPELAARAHDVAALALRGEAAALNFADSAWLLPRANSCSPSDIRMAVRRTEIQYHSSSSSTSSVSYSSGCSLVAAADDAVLQETTPSELGFWDEEEVFNFPGLIDSMAEGMLLTPPAYKQGVNWDDALSSVDLFNLWSY